MKQKQITVAFHIGCGGRFHNPGHKSFNRKVTSLQECFSEDSVIINEDEKGNAIPDEKWVLIDGAGDVIIEGREAIESETGILEWDTIYDTDIVKYIEDCTDEEIELIYKSYINEETIFSPYEDEIYAYVLQRKGLHKIEDVFFYKTNAKIAVAEWDEVGVPDFFWDGTEDVDEDGIRDWMEQHDIDPVSIDKYADSFVEHFYND